MARALYDGIADFADDTAGDMAWKMGKFVGAIRFEIALGLVTAGAALLARRGLMATKWGKALIEFAEQVADVLPIGVGPRIREVEPTPGLAEDLVYPPERAVRVPEPERDIVSESASREPDGELERVSLDPGSPGNGLGDPRHRIHERAAGAMAGHRGQGRRLPQWHPPRRRKPYREAEQGTREYLDSILREMGSRIDADPEAARIAGNLRKACAGNQGGLRRRTSTDPGRRKSPATQSETLRNLRWGVMRSVRHHLRPDDHRLATAIAAADDIIETAKVEAAGHPALFKLLLESCVTAAACASVPAAAGGICRYLRIGGVAGLAALQSMLGQRGTVEIDGVNIKIKRLAPEKMAIGGTTFWREAFAMALASGDDDCARQLSEQPLWMAPLTNPNVRWDPWSATLNEALVALYRDDPTATVLAARLGQESAAAVQYSDSRYVREVVPKIAAALDSVGRRSSGAIDAAFEEALLAHHDYWKRSGRSGSLDSLLALELLALARIAHQRRMSPQVDSPYLPRIVFAEGCVE
jgi:hypothetical protein